MGRKLEEEVPEEVVEQYPLVELPRAKTLHQVLFLEQEAMDHSRRG